MGSEEKNYARAGWGIFFIALLVRSIADLVFFARSGWFSSHLIEIWFYYGVARGVYFLSPLDPTFLLLRLTGRLFPESVLYPAVVFLAAAVTALTAWLIYGWLGRRYGWVAGVGGGIIYALLPAPITLSLVNFSHDLVALPLVVIFFRAAAAQERGEGRVRAAIAALLCLVFGLAVGPLIAAALVVLLIYSLWPLCRRLLRRPPAGLVSALFLGGLVVLSAVLFLVMRANLLDWISPLALRFRGIDLAAQMTIQVGDLQPLPPDALWNRYTFFVFLLPWGFWTAFRKKDFFILTLFLFALALSLVVNRGARLLDLAVVGVAAAGLAEWKKPAARTAAASALVWLLVNLAFPGAARAVYAGLPFDLKVLWSETAGRILSSGPPPDPVRVRYGMLFLGFFALGLAGPIFFREKKFQLAAILLTAAFLQIGWVLEVAQTSSTESEYRAYRWLADRSRPGEKIFAAWNQGYFIGSVTGLDPITTPERIDLSLWRLYWEEEDRAVRELLRRGVSYVHVNSRYFGVTAVNLEADTFGMRGSTIIGPRPDHIRRFSRMRRTFLFQLLYEPEKLQRLRPIYEKTDPENRLLIRIFQLDPAAGTN